MQKASGEFFKLLKIVEFKTKRILKHKHQYIFQYVPTNDIKELYHHFPYSAASDYMSQCASVIEVSQNDISKISW